MTTSPEGSEAVHDSPTGWVNRHIEEYVATDGRKGHRWSGVDTLLLTTRGRKSGKLRRTALIYGIDAGNYVVVGSRGGHKYHPAWYLNLVATPRSGSRWARSTMIAAPERPPEPSAHDSGR